MYIPHEKHAHLLRELWDNAPEERTKVTSGLPGRLQLEDHEAYAAIGAPVKTLCGKRIEVDFSTCYLDFIQYNREAGRNAGEHCLNTVR